MAYSMAAIRLVVALDVADSVQPGGDRACRGTPRMRLHPRHVQVEEVDERADRLVQLLADLVTAVVVKASGVTGPAIGRVEDARPPSAPPRPWR